MASRQKSFAVSLTIPDNEASTALETLRRIGVDIGRLRRADIWTFEIDESVAATFDETLATVEAVFNPNKHRLSERPNSRPLDGEIWIAPQDETPVASVGGRMIAGVNTVQRRVGWQLFDAHGRPADSTLLEHAVATFLCNPAFQKAIR